MHSAGQHSNKVSAQAALTDLDRSPGTAGHAPAYASYSHYSNHQSGFGQLRVQTSPAFSNKVQMQAAGFIEGYLTAPQIFDHWYNQRWWLLQKTNDSYKILDWCAS